jgi:serine/threonine protein kinase
MNIIHRDIKPGNIMLREINPEATYFCAKYQVVIIDFGLSARDDDHTSSSFLHDKSGTVGYLAPEILQNTQKNVFYGTKVDVYSAGIIFVEL